MSPGKHEIKYEFIWTRKAWSTVKCALYVDGQKVGRGVRISKTQPYAFSQTKPHCVGVDNETMVSNDYKPGEEQVHRQNEKVTKIRSLQIQARLTRKLWESKMHENEV